MPQVRAPLFWALTWACDGKKRARLTDVPLGTTKIEAVRPYGPARRPTKSVCEAALIAIALFVFPILAYSVLGAPNEAGRKGHANSHPHC